MHVVDQDQQFKLSGKEMRYDGSKASFKKGTNDESEQVQVFQQKEGR